MTVTPACEAIEPDCARPETHTQVQYCWTWDLWLCANCRLKRNDAELRVSLDRWPKPRTLPADPILQL